MKNCSYCENEINTEVDTYFMCLDNFIQAKYFDADENIFCCKDCFCNYVQLEEMNDEGDETND